MWTTLRLCGLDLVEEDDLEGNCADRAVLGQDRLEDQLPRQDPKVMHTLWTGSGKTDPMIRRGGARPSMSLDWARVWTRLAASGALRCGATGVHGPDRIRPTTGLLEKRSLVEIRALGAHARPMFRLNKIPAGPEHPLETMNTELPPPLTHPTPQPLPVSISGDGCAWHCSRLLEHPRLPQRRVSTSLDGLGLRVRRRVSRGPGRGGAGNAAKGEAAEAEAAAELGPNSVNFGRAWVEIAPDLVGTGPTSAGVGRIFPIAARCWAKSAQVGQSQLNFLRDRLNVGRDRPSLAEISPTLAEVGQLRPNSAQIWLTSARIRSKSRFDRGRANFARALPDLAEPKRRSGDAPMGNVPPHAVCQPPGSIIA